MRVFAVSDLHLSINNPKPMDIFGMVWENYLPALSESWKQVEPEDVVLIGGDISWAMTLENALPDLEFIAGFPGRKVLLRGNHDYWWSSLSKLRAALPPGMYALQNDFLRFGDVLIAGTRGWIMAENKPLSPADEVIFKRENERLKLSLAAAGKDRREGDKLVVLTHYPPFNLKKESNAFLDTLLSVGPDACVYGHLHGKYVKNDSVTVIGGVPFYLTSCDLTGNKLVRVL